jgi:hypothetical protein
MGISEKQFTVCQRGGGALAQLVADGTLDRNDGTYLNDGLMAGFPAYPAAKHKLLYPCGPGNHITAVQAYRILPGDPVHRSS